MFFGVYKAELYKIIKSYRFKIVLLVILACSTYNIVNAYKKFPQYNCIYEQNKKDYINKIDEYEKDLHELNNEIDIYISKSILDFYKNHFAVEPKQDFSQGMAEAIFNDTYWLPLLLLFCADIVCFEKTRNITKVQFATGTSRVKLYYSKYMAMLSAMLIVFSVNLIFSFIFSGYLMGFSDLSSSIRSVLCYSMATVERSVIDTFIIKSVLTILILASAAVLFLVVSTLVQDVVTSYIISVLLVTNSWSFYNAFGNGTGIFRYFFISFYSGIDLYFYGQSIYSIKVGVISMVVQSILLYFFGYHFYKRIE